MFIRQFTRTRLVRGQCYRHKVDGGFTLMEMMIVLAIAALVLLAAGQEKVLEARKAVTFAAAGQINAVGDAVKAYIAYVPNKTSIEATGDRIITITDLLATTSCGPSTACLSTSVLATGASLNPWDSGYSIKIRRIGASAPYGIEFLVVTNTGYIVDGVTQLAAVADAAGKVGPQIGRTTNFGGAMRAVGTAGAWVALATDYPAIVAGAGSAPGGQLAYFFRQTGLAYDSVYLKLDGSNSMSANLNMGGYGMYGVSRGINAAGVTAPGSAGNNDLVLSGNATVGGTATVTGNTVLGGNLTLTAPNAQLTLSGASSDIKMASLQTTAVSGGVALTTQSLTALAPRLVEVSTMNVGNGTVVPAPTCPGGSPSIFVMPSTALMTVTGGTAGYLFSATPTAGGWNVIAWDISTPGTCGGSNGVPANGATCLNNPNGAIARVFCQY